MTPKRIALWFLIVSVAISAALGILAILTGNFGDFGFPGIDSPASAEAALAVGAVDRDDERAAFSSFGPTADGLLKPDVTALGVGIVAAMASLPPDVPPIGDPVGTAYQALSGTSMATPHVAGAAAILLEQHPGWTGAQLKAQLTSSAKPNPDLVAFQQGTGRIDLDRATRQQVTVQPASLSFGQALWPHTDDPVLVQVSRWDRLKDMAGVMRGFADHVAPGGDGYLMLVGPAVKDVSDDPEGAAVYGECLLQWRDLSPAARTRILLVTLPLDDIDENAAMVNALQRHATVIAQKSLAEGFGLTVAEGMWKGRPVIGSAVGGIIDQIAKGTGILLPDPADLTAFGSAACRLLGDQDKAARMGQAAHAHVREQYVGDAHLLRYAQLLGTLIGDG